MSYDFERLSYFVEPKSAYNATREEEAQYVRENMTLDWECLTLQDSKISGYGGHKHNKEYQALYNRTCRVVFRYGDIVVLEVLPEDGKPYNFDLYAYHVDNLCCWANENSVGAWRLAKRKKFFDAVRAIWEK